MKTLTERLQETMQQAVEQTKGLPSVDINGDPVNPPTTVEIAKQFIAQREAITGQKTPPPASGWRMSNNTLSKRVDVLEKRDADEAERLNDAIEGVVSLFSAQLQLQADDFTARLEAQQESFAAQLMQARTDLHTEILGNVGPALEAINLLKAHDASDDAADMDIHTQLFAAVGNLSNQITSALQSVNILATAQSTTTTQVGNLQTTVTQHTTDIASLKTVDAGLRTDLTTQTSRIDTVTATANSAQNTANGLLTSVGNLTATVNENTAQLGKRIRNDQNDGTTYNLTAKKATTNGQVVVFEQVKQQNALNMASPAMALGASVTVNVTWPTPFADANYAVSALPASASLLGLQIGSSNRTATGCTLTLKNTLGVALLAGAGNLDITATHY